MSDPLYSRRPDVLWRSTADRVLLRPLDSGGLVTITGSGAFLWELLASPISFESLVTSMAMHYSVERDLVAEPVALALAELEQASVIKRLKGDPAPNATATHVGVPRQRAAEGSR